MGSCLNVINSQAANYSNYSNKYGTKRYCYGIKLRSQISAAFLEKKLISAAALIRVNSVHFLLHCET